MRAYTASAASLKPFKHVLYEPLQQKIETFFKLAESIVAPARGQLMEQPIDGRKKLDIKRQNSETQLW